MRASKLPLLSIPICLCGGLWLIGYALGSMCCGVRRRQRQGQICTLPRSMLHTHSEKAMSARLRGCQVPRDFCYPGPYRTGGEASERSLETHNDCSSLPGRRQGYEVTVIAKEAYQTDNGTRHAAECCCLSYGVCGWLFKCLYRL